MNWNRSQVTEPNWPLSSFDTVGLVWLVVLVLGLIVC